MGDGPGEGFGTMVGQEQELDSVADGEDLVEEADDDLDDVVDDDADDAEDAEEATTRKTMKTGTAKRTI